jgi:hypothetical protein
MKTQQHPLTFKIAYEKLSSTSSLTMEILATLQKKFRWQEIEAGSWRSVTGRPWQVVGSR